MMQSFESRLLYDIDHFHARAFQSKQSIRGWQRRTAVPLDYYGRSEKTCDFSEMSSPSANLTLSKYVKHLDGVLKKRYIAKK